MTHVDEEIASQPDCWRQAIGVAELAGRRLPTPGSRVAAVGCGTSLNIARCYAHLREQAGQGETDAFAAASLPLGRHYDEYVFFSRTGTTSETVAALRAVSELAPTTAITASAGTPLATEADRPVLIEFVNEQAVVQTRFFTTVVFLLRLLLGAEPEPLLRDAESAVAAPLADGALGARQHTFLGRGWTTPLAEEATLKLRETAQVWAEGHDAMEYRHGPISIAEPGVAIWCVGAPPPGLEAEALATGAAFFVGELDPLAEVIRVQRLAVALAAGRGIDPDAPRHLSRSIVLDDSQLSGIGSPP